MIPHFNSRRCKHSSAIGIRADGDGNDDGGFHPDGRGPCLGLLLGAVLMMSGCSTPAPFLPPAVQMPDRLTGDTVPASAPRPSATLTREERDFIQALAPDRDLAAMVELGLANNTDYRQAVHQVATARAQYRVQAADQWPTPGLSATRTRQRFSNDAQNARYGQNLNTTTLGISDYEVDLFGRLDALTDAARERYLASTHGQQAVRGALIAEMLRAYIVERCGAQALDIATALREHTDHLVDEAERRQRVGLASRDEVDAIRARQDRAALAESQSRQAWLAAWRALRLMTGTELIPPGPLEGLAPTTETTTALRDLDSRVLLERPDVRQAESELRAAHADVAAARAAFFPSIRLSTSIGTASEHLQGLFGGGSGVWTFMPQVNLPLFNRGRLQSALDGAQSQRDASVAHYEQTIQHAFREVLDTLDAQAVAMETERRQADQDQRAQQRLRRMAVRADAGWVDRADLLLERIGAGQSSLARLQARRELAMSRVALFRAFYGVALPVTL